MVAVLNGAVIGGGLELALATHIRVAEPSAFYALPEGSRGIFVGGGASMRLPRLIGVHRMADMMLTGRVLDATEGNDLGISQYLVADGEGYAKGIEIAKRIAENAAITNYAVLQALPRELEVTAVVQVKGGQCSGPVNDWRACWTSTVRPSRRPLTRAPQNEVFS